MLPLLMIRMELQFKMLTFCLFPSWRREIKFWCLDLHFKRSHENQSKINFLVISFSQKHSKISCPQTIVQTFIPSFPGGWTAVTVCFSETERSLSLLAPKDFSPFVLVFMYFYVPNSSNNCFKKGFL